MPADDAGIDEDEDEHRVPTGTWASTPGILAPQDLDEEPDDVALGAGAAGAHVPDAAGAARPVRAAVTDREVADEPVSGGTARSPRTVARGPVGRRDDGSGQTRAEAPAGRRDESSARTRAEASAAGDAARSRRARAEPALHGTPHEEAVESHVRPRFLASELMRQRSESHEPIWPTVARVAAIAGGGLAAALALGVAATEPVGLGAGALALLGVLAALAPLSVRARAVALAVFGGLTILTGALLSRHAPDVLLGGAALAATSGGLLRARRFRSLGARGLFVLAAALGVAGLVLDGGVRVLSIDSFSLVALAPALRQLALGAALLLPLVTLLDASGPSGALAVATAWIVERLVDGALHVSLEGAVPAAVGPLVGALVLPAAALGLAQAMPSAASQARRPRGRAQAA